MHRFADLRPVVSYEPIKLHNYNLSSSQQESLSPAHESQRMLSTLLRLYSHKQKRDSLCRLAYSRRESRCIDCARQANSSANNTRRLKTKERVNEFLIDSRIFNFAEQCARFAFELHFVLKMKREISRYPPYIPIDERRVAERASDFLNERLSNFSFFFSR